MDQTLDPGDEASELSIFVRPYLDLRGKYSWSPLFLSLWTSDARWLYVGEKVTTIVTDEGVGAELEPHSFGYPGPCGEVAHHLRLRLIDGIIYWSSFGMTFEPWSEEDLRIMSLAQEANNPHTP